MSVSIPFAETAADNQRQRLTVVILCFLIFVVLGVPDGMIGVAFTSMREEFGLGLESFGMLFIATTAGFLLSSSVVGRLLIRFDVAAFLVAAGIFRAVSLAGYVVLPSWWGVVSSAFVLGIASGLIDAGMNTWFAMRFSPRLMNWLHASFGLGATLGPLIMWAVLASSLSWRWGYGVIVFLQLVVCALVFATRRQWQLPATLGVVDANGDPHKEATVGETLRLPAVWLGIAIFFFYTGAELTAGNWSYMLFTEGRGVSAAQASLWVSIYWASFTLGRVVFGFVTTSSLPRLLRACLLSALVGSLILAWAPGPWAGFAGLALLGFSVAPVFPLLVSETPFRIGAHYAQHAIGFQVGAASLGIAVLPSIAGVLAGRSTLEAIPIFISVVMVVLIVLHELMVRTHVSTESA